MTASLFIIAILATGFITSPIAYAMGRTRGIHVGWLQHHFRVVDEERARRNRLGQFQKTGGKK